MECSYTHTLPPNTPVVGKAFTKKKVLLFNCELREILFFGGLRNNKRDDLLFLSAMNLEFKERPKVEKPKAQVLVSGRLPH
jgi:hypothetical protein